MSRADLARVSELSDSTIERAEEGGQVRNATKYRIRNALNARPNRLKDYTVEDLFGESHS